MSLSEKRMSFLLIAVGVLLLAAGDVLAESYEATIYRDEFGVPHIVAESLRDAAFGDGYAQAEDRLQLVMNNIQQATGTRAASQGKRFVRQDYISRVIGSRKVAYEAWDVIAPEMRDIYSGFAAGVNRYVESHPDDLPENARRIEPQEVFALIKYAGLGRQFNQARQDRKRQGEVPISGEGDVQNEDGGSNGSVLAPSRSVSGNAIVFCDPHTPWNGVNRWYEKHYLTPQVNVYGSMTTGVPLFVFGTTDHVSWTLTRNPGDRGDCFVVESLNKKQYLFDGQPRNFKVREEIIEVKGSEPVRREVLETIHGPVFEQEGKNVFAAGMSHNTIDIKGDQLLGILLSRDVHEFRQAMATRELDGANMFVGDAKGNIGYFWMNRLMDRDDSFYWLGPVDGSTSKSLYKGLLPFDQMPQSVNDPDGYYQASNAANWTLPEGAWGMKPSDFPGWLLSYRNGQYYSARPQRVVDLIESRPKHTLEQTMEMGLDSRALAAEWATPALELGHKSYGSGSRPEVGEALSILRAWVAEGAEAERTSRGYPIFRELVGQPGGGGLADFRNTFGDWRRGDEAAEKKIRVLYDRFVGAVNSMMEHYGTVSIPWETINVIRLSDGTTFPSGTGDSSTQTVWQGSQGRRDPDGKWLIEGGSDFMMATEMSQPPVIHTLVPYGQSEDPASPHFSDQSERWTKGQWKPARFTKEDVEQYAKSRKTVRNTLKKEMEVKP